MTLSWGKEKGEREQEVSGQRQAVTEGGREREEGVEVKGGERAASVGSERKRKRH